MMFDAQPPKTLSSLSELKWKIAQPDCISEQCEKLLSAYRAAKSIHHARNFHSTKCVKAFSRQQRSALQPSHIQLIYHRTVWTFRLIFSLFFLRSKDAINYTCRQYFFTPSSDCSPFHVRVIKFFADFLNGEHISCRWKYFLHHGFTAFPLFTVTAKGKDEILPTVAISTPMFQNTGHLQPSEMSCIPSGFVKLNKDTQ